LTSLFALLEEWQNHLFVSQYKKNCFPSNRWNISKIFEWTSHIMALPPQKVYLNSISFSVGTLPTHTLGNRAFILYLCMLQST
jgi:hypothetical protein